MADIKDQLRAARLPEKTVDICLRGDLAAAYEQAQAALDRAVEDRGDRLDSGSEVTDLRQRMDDLQEQMVAANVTFRLRAMARRDYRALVAAHPPRKNEAGEVDAKDELLEFNRESFYVPLIRSCVVEPELDDEDWQTLDERLTDRQWDELFLAAWNLNRRDVDVPFSLAGSRTQT